MTRSFLLAALLIAVPNATASQTDQGASVQSLTAREFPGIDRPWLGVATDTLIVLSDASARRVQAAIEELEAFRAVLRVFFPALAQAPRRTTQIYLFDSSREFQFYGTERRGIAGFFLSRPEANYIAVDGTTRNPYGTVLHEYVHYLLRNNVPDLPLWLNEGLAEYFDGFSVRRGQAEFGGPNAWGQYLATHDWIDFEEVLSTRASSERYRDPAKSAAFRAQAWALTHFLYADPNRDLLVAVMQALGRREPVEEALLSGRAKTFGELAKNIRRHLRKGVQRSRVVDLEQLPIPEVPGVRGVERVEVLTQLGRLLAIHPTDERAVRAHHLFEAAILASPRHVAAIAGKGALLARRSEHLDDAKRLLDDVIALAPDHAAALYYRARVHMAPGEPGEGTAESLSLARQDLERVRVVDPHFRVAVNDLAHTYLNERGLVPRGIEMIEQELDHGPDLTLAMTLMELYARNGDRAAAWRVHDERIERWLDADGEGEGATGIAEAIEQTDLLVAQAWLEDGRCSEARELLSSAVSRATHDEVRARLRASLEAMTCRPAAVPGS